MLNHSVSQLRQIRLSDLGVAQNRPLRSTSGAANVPSSPRVTQVREQEGAEIPARPSPLRRRSTRTKQYGEPSTSRLQRFEAAIDNNTFESFIVLYEGREVIYISEMQTGMCPVYLPFEIDSRTQQVEIAAYVRRPDKPWQLLFRSIIHLQDVSPLPAVHAKGKRNQIELQFEDDTWYTPGQVGDDAAVQTQSTLVSYSFNQAMRLQSSTEVINDALHSIVKLKENLAGLLQDADQRLQRCRELDLCRFLGQETQDSTKSIQKQLATDRARLAKMRESNKLRTSLLSSGRAHMKSVATDIDLLKTKLSARQPALDLLATEIRRLQREVTTTLSEIYPITISSHETRIRGLKPARNSDYWMQNHEESAALGYIAHFIFLLSHYLYIPLRYPVRPVSSHSFIIDPVSIMPDNSDVQGGPPYSIKKDRRFPLFYERGGVERLQWGAFLLNKDIEQLLQGRGLVCGDLRDSLHNLGGLVVWLVSVNEEEDTSLTRPRRQTSMTTMTGTRARHGGTDHEIEQHAALEITDHEDLLAAQLRSRVKGKRRMTLVSEKDEEVGDLEQAINQVSVS